MPDDYYVSQYSGEEIDERLTAAHNAVRYDAAQSLNDAQKTQARANIAAAPKGFGLGDVWNIAPSRDADLITGSGFQMAVLNTPTGNSWWGILSFIYDADTATQWAMSQNNAEYYGSVCKREKRAGTWTPWELVNPPMWLGIEFRTTERYIGKPVYCKLVDFGKLPNNAVKEVSHGISNLQYAISVAGASDGDNLIGNMYITYVHVSPTNIRIETNADRSGVSATVLIKYTKTTD